MDAWFLFLLYLVVGLVGPTGAQTTQATTTTHSSATATKSTLHPTPATTSTATTKPFTSTRTPYIISTIRPSTTTTTTTTPRTPTTTRTTVAPTTPLQCENGFLLNSVCICPDEWTGETCSEKNVCEFERLSGFRFPRTPIGWFSYSEENCPEGTSGAGKPQASIRCSNNTGSPQFVRPPQVLQCDQTLSDIQKNLTSAANLETLASSTQMLTSNPKELTSKEVTTAAQIANTLLLSPNSTENVRVAAVATVSQLLSASAPDETEEDGAASGLTRTLDQLSVNLSTNLHTSQSQLVQPNLVVQSAQVPAADTRGVQFTSLAGTSGSFMSDRIQLDTNVSSVVVENSLIADVLIYIQFPPEAANIRQPPSNVSLGFVLYQNDRFFQSRRYRSRHATVRVLSANVGGQEGNVVAQHVEMMFRPMLMDDTALLDFACVFWDYAEDDWSTTGCFKGNASDGVLRCFCNHTTNFAALWSFRHKYEYAQALDLISTVGLSFSILGLVITIIHHIKDQFQKKSGQRNINSSVALLSIYVSLLAFIITFLSGVQHSGREETDEAETPSQANVIPDSDEYVERDSGSCTAVAALLHFFLLATFTWNSVYGTQLVLLVRSMRRSLPSYWTWLSMVVGWGAPAAVVGITLGVTYKEDNPLGYRQEEFCWLAALNKDDRIDLWKPMLWSFILPIGVILIYNGVLLVLTSVTTCRTDPTLESTSRHSLSRKFLTSFSLAVLLGLSWSLGYLVLISKGHIHLVFSILFCLCTTTQGFQIFIFFTARTPSFRATVSHSMEAVSSVNIALHKSKYTLWKKWKTMSTESYKDVKDTPTSTSQMM